MLEARSNGGELSRVEEDLRTLVLLLHLLLQDWQTVPVVERAAARVIRLVAYEPTARALRHEYGLLATLILLR